MGETETIPKLGLGERAEEIYGALLDIHQQLSYDESTTFNARLVMLLANELDDLERLKTIFRLAKVG